MDVFPKFIVETTEEHGDCIVLGKATYHKHLATNVAKVKGGGWYSINVEKKTLVFGGRSHDFGSVNPEVLKDCVKRGKVFDRLFIRDFVEMGYTFWYSEPYGDRIELKVEV